MLILTPTIFGAGSPAVRKLITIQPCGKAVEGELFGEYLAVTPALGGGFKPRPGRYVVTHIPTGMAVWSGKGNALARKVAKALVGLPWQKIKTPRSKKALAEIGPLRNEILNKLGFGEYL